MKLPSQSILGGIAGPLLFAIIITIAGSLRPEYSHASQFISELGETGGQNATLMNYLGFMASASLIFIFALTLLFNFTSNLLTGIASVLIGLFSIGMFFAGVYSCDATCMPVEATSDHLTHNLVSFAAFVALILGTLLWGVALFRKSGWVQFAIYSVVTATLAVIFLYAMIDTAPTRNGTGLFQRLFLTSLFSWMAIFAFRLWGSNPKWKLQE